MAHTRPTIDPKLRIAIDEAARWSIKLQGAEDCPALQAEWKRWLLASPEHHTAWTRLQHVQQRFAAVPGHIALPALTEAGQKRRRGLQLALAGLTAAPLAWWMAETEPWTAWTADLTTGTGEVRTVTLPDSTQLTLDAQSSVDISFDQGTRALTLLAGKIHIDTGHQANERRPFVVRTRHGQIEALGTEFVVRTTPRFSGVQVNQHAVRITPARQGQAAVQVDAGHVATFSGDGILRPTRTTAADFAPWRHGSLIATEMPLGQLIDQLKPYRSGYLGLDPDLAKLKVSGVFPLARTDLALAALENSHPVKVHHFTRYWTWISAS